MVGSENRACDSRLQIVAVEHWVHVSNRLCKNWMFFTKIAKAASPSLAEYFSIRTKQRRSENRRATHGVVSPGENQRAVCAWQLCHEFFPAQTIRSRRDSIVLWIETALNYGGCVMQKRYAYFGYGTLK
jgi:hypothetical protein